MPPCSLCCTVSPIRPTRCPPCGKGMELQLPAESAMSARNCRFAHRPAVASSFAEGPAALALSGGAQNLTATSSSSAEGMLSWLGPRRASLTTAGGARHGSRPRQHPAGMQAGRKGGGSACSCPRRRRAWGGPKPERACSLNIRRNGWGRPRRTLPRVLLPKQGCWHPPNLPGPQRSQGRPKGRYTQSMRSSHATS